MNGLLLVLKPAGMTSHDVVACVRRLTRAKVGHTGTLDPLAAGLLVLCLGQATKLTEYLALDAKSYRAEVSLGIETDTLDAEGLVTDRRDAREVTVDAVAEALAGLVGETSLAAPIFSALKRDGQPLYKAARSGAEVEAPIRSMLIGGCRLLAFSPGAAPTVLFDVDCAKGTYIRSVAAELGRRLGCGGYLSFLLRTRVGGWVLDQASDLQQIEAAHGAGTLGESLISCAEALPHLPAVMVDAAVAARLRCGTPQPVDDATATEDGLLRIIDPAGLLVCIGWIRRDREGPVLMPKTVLSL
jgi:tRNA pseudouridine55 synthase